MCVQIVLSLYVKRKEKKAANAYTGTHTHMSHQIPQPPEHVTKQFPHNCEQDESGEQQRKNEEEKQQSEHRA